MRVLLVDDDRLFRALIREMILHAIPEAEVVGEASNGAEAIESAINLRPDVVLIDFAMPHMDGAAAARLIKRAAPETRIVMLSGTDRSAEAATLIAAKLIRKAEVSHAILRTTLAQP